MKIEDIKTTKGRAYRNRYLLLTSVFIIIELIGIILYSSTTEIYLKWVSLLILTGLAAMAAGSIFGFIIGIPRLNKNYTPSLNDNKFEGNTNLEEISDWITKLIIGVTLTQVILFPKFLSDIADTVVKAAQCPEKCGVYDKTIVITVIIYNFIFGFYLGYLGARILLVKIFNSLAKYDSLVLENKNDSETINNIISIEESKMLNINLEEAKTNIFIQSLTSLEKTFLKNLASKDYKYVIKGIPDFDDFVAIKSLLKKQILYIVEGGDFERGKTLMISNDYQSAVKKELQLD
jgi:hypothetical protein